MWSAFHTLSSFIPWEVSENTALPNMWFLCLWTDKSLLMCGLRAVVVILLLVGIFIYFAWNKKKNEKAEVSAVPQTRRDPEDSVLMIEMSSATCANTEFHLLSTEIWQNNTFLFIFLANYVPHLSSSCWIKLWGFSAFLFVEALITKVVNVIWT